MPDADARKCARCGLVFGYEPNQCGDFTDGSNPDLEKDALERLDERVLCRDRELGNLRALLRGSTRQLEKVVQVLSDVLEVWS